MENGGAIANCDDGNGNNGNGNGNGGNGNNGIPDDVEVNVVPADVFGGYALGGDPLPVILGEDVIIAKLRARRRSYRAIGGALSVSDRLPVVAVEDVRAIGELFREFGFDGTVFIAPHLEDRSTLDAIIAAAEEIGIEIDCSRS